MQNLLLAPPVAFLIFLALAGLLSYLGRLLAGPEQGLVRGREFRRDLDLLGGPAARKGQSSECHDDHYGYEFLHGAPLLDRHHSLGWE